jgi:hypothetical protein
VQVAGGAADATAVAAVRQSLALGKAAGEA